MHRCLSFIALAACAAPAAPPRGPVAGQAAPREPPVEPAAAEPPAEPPDWAAARLSIDWGRTPLATDDQALAAWREVLAAGRDWELRVAQIPDDAIAPLGRALLRGGNFACAPLVGGGCEPELLGYADPAPAATFADPCLRRHAALWALANLDGADIAAIEPALAALIGSPHTDLELVDSILSAAGDQPEAMRLALIGAALAAGHGAAVDDELHGLSEAAMIDAATNLHVDAAVEALDVSLARGVFLAAAVDRRLRPATRATAIRELAAEVPGQALPRDLERVLRLALDDPDCGVAGTAATTLTSFGRRSGVPRRPRRARVGAAMRALCVIAAADAVDAARGFIGPAGLKVIERGYDADLEFAHADDDNADGDGDPRTSRTVDTITRGTLVAIPHDDQLARGATCTSSRTEHHCTIRESVGVTITVAFVVAADHGLWLDAIERHDSGGCDPKPP